MKIIVGITGASGSIYGLRLIEELARQGHQLHLVLTDSGRKVFEYETGTSTKSLASFGTVYDNNNVGAAIASGSFLVDKMVVVPCSMKTVAAIAHSITDNLLVRAADVTLKEGRELLLVPRETPMHKGHLQNLLTAAELGAVIVPAMPAFYHRPKNLTELVDHLVGKILDRLEIAHELYPRWQG